MIEKELAGFYANQSRPHSLWREESPLNELLWGERYLNDFSEWRKAELRRGRSNLAKETKMLKKTERPAGIPASHRLVIETLRKYDLFQSTNSSGKVKQSKWRQWIKETVPIINTWSCWLALNDRIGISLCSLIYIRYLNLETRHIWKLIDRHQLGT